MSEQIEIISSTDTLKVCSVKEPMTVEKFLGKMNLANKFFAVLVDGKKVGLKDTIESGKEITILPKIAGG